MQGDVAIDKENVEPRGSAAWNQQASLAKNRGLGARYETLRKEKSSVLASNTTTNNGGGAAGPVSFEWLKERVKLLKLSSTDGASGDSGSRLLKHRSPLVDLQSTEGSINSSFGSSSSKDGTGNYTGQERSAAQSQEIPRFSKLSHSRANSSEQAERNQRSSLHSNGGHLVSKSHGPGSLKVLELYQEDAAKSRGRREATRSRGSEVGQTTEDTGSSSLVGSVSELHVKASGSLGTTQHHLEGKTLNPQGSSTSGDSGVWSGCKRQGTPYKRGLPLLGEAEVGKITEGDESQSNNNQFRAAVHASSTASVSLRLLQQREVESSETRDKKNKVGAWKASERNVKGVGLQSVDRVSERRASAYPGTGIESAEIGNAPVADTAGEGLSEKRITFSESFRVSRSSEIWDHSEDGFTSHENHNEESSKWASSHANKDANVVATSSFLVSTMTGSSSSGSSATPGSSGGSSRDDDTGRCPGSSKQQTPSPDEHVVPSSRERMSSRTRISKRLKSLGPASRLLVSGPALRVAVDDRSSASKGEGSSRSVMPSQKVLSCPLEKRVSSGLQVLTPVTPEESQKCQDADLLGDFKKRKAEDDPSIGNVSQDEKKCSTENEVPFDSAVQSALPSASDSLPDVHRSHLVGLNARLLREPQGSLPSLDKFEEFGTRYRILQLGVESTNGDDAQLPKSSLPEGSSDVAPVSKGGSKETNIHDVNTAASLSRTTPDKPLNGLGSAQNSVDIVSRQQGQLLDRGVAPIKQPIDGAGRFGNSSISSSHLRPKNSPSSDARQRASETNRSGVLPSTKENSDVKEGSEAVSMSQDVLSIKDRSDSRPGSVQDLSNSLGSLSIGERETQTKIQSRPPLKNLVNISSSNPPLATVNESGGMRSLENLGVPPNTSHSSGRSAVTTENQPPIQHSICLPSEKLTKELGEDSKERCTKDLRAEAGLNVAPSERSEAAASSAQRPHEDPRKEDSKGAAVATQRKVLEDEKFFWVNDGRYQKLGMIGKGGSSEVYKVIDSEFSIYALKKITLRGRDRSTALGFYQEIEYLERLRGKRHIVQLIDYEVTNRFVVDEDYGEEKIREDACIYMVLEFGEIDLAGILSKKRKEMLENNEPVDDNWIRFYWKHMLTAVKTIHDDRIVHADLKPANFLLVKGELKLIDFGIAKAIQTDTTHVVRDSQVGTLNYMPPEALMNNSTDEDGRVFKCGRSSDIWSLGCILYQMVYGHTPYSHIRSMFGKIQAITSKHFKMDYPPIRDPWLLDVMKKCLTWDRHSRPDIAQLLVHPFLRPDLAPYK